MVGLEAGKLLVLLLAGPAVLSHDAATYWELGQRIAEGDWWLLHVPIAYRTPGYPWVLGLCRYMVGDGAWWLLLVLQHVAVGITTWLVLRWVWEETGEVRAVAMTFMLAWLSWGRASYAAVVLSETFFTLCLTAAVWGMRYPSCWTLRGWWWLSTALSGACLLRPVGLVLWLPWCWQTWKMWQQAGKLPQGVGSRRSGITTREVLLAAVLTSGVGWLPIVAWVMRNGIVTQHWAYTVFLGRELWVGCFGPGWPGPLNWPDTPTARELMRSLPPEVDRHHNWSVARGLMHAGYSDAQADDLMRQVACAAIARQPGRFAWRAVNRGVLFWRVKFDPAEAHYLQAEPSSSQASGSAQFPWRITLAVWLRGLSWHWAWERARWLTELAWMAGACWIWRCWRKTPPPQRSNLTNSVSPCLWTIVSLWLFTSLLEYPNYRYRMVLEPLFLALFGVCWPSSRHALKAERSPSSVQDN